MTWFKVDDSFSSHPAVLAADAAAIGLWVLAGAWSTRHRTAGLIPTGLPERLVADGDEHAATLVRCGLWRRRKAGWRMVEALPAIPAAKRLPLWTVERDDYRKKIPHHIRRAVYERDGHQCTQCGTADDLTLDHIYPWSLGGPDTVDNLRLLCRSCNSSKGARV